MLSLPPTPLALGAGAPLVPSACQAGRWALVASRLAESSAACHAVCCREGGCQTALQLARWTTRLAGMVCSLLPAWRAVSIPRLACSLGHLGILEGCSAAGTTRTSRCLPGPCHGARKLSSGSPETKPHLWHCSTLRGFLCCRVPLRQGCCYPHSLAPLVPCQSPPGWDTAQVPLMRCWALP